MPLDDQVNSATPTTPPQALPRSGKTQKAELVKSDKNSAKNQKDQIIINPDIKDIVQEKVARKLLPELEGLTPEKFNKMYESFFGTSDIAEAKITKARNAVKGKEDNAITHVELPSHKLKKHGIDHHEKDNYGRTSTFKHGKEHVNVYQRGYIASSGKHVVSVRGVNGASEAAIKNVIKKLREDYTVADLTEDAADHLRQASIAQNAGKPLKASLHRRIAAAMQSGDMTTVASLKIELQKVK